MENEQLGSVVILSVVPGPCHFIHLAGMTNTPKV